ncbi:MAG: hypothetical protein A2Z07_05515 [Armatimonadetes bacterium RBG_16_67_12]|nr:MAG: hypothetical protein A2Z07_05515 [Armatimonadetes bacterium RBG_16_67_12]
MRSPAPAAIRHDPKKIYAIHVDRAAGLSADEIAAKHSLSTLTVHSFLRATDQASPLASPYGFKRGTLPPNAAVQMYWLGYIAACGRVLGQNSYSTVVLAIHPDDEAHVQTLMSDLVVGHARVEFADSNLDGRQAYLRDRQLAEVLRQWGVSAVVAEGSVPLEFVPPACIPDFVRGYLEGSRLSPPFGGKGARAPSPRPARALTFVGQATFIAELDRALRSACGVRAGQAEPSGASGMARITYSLEEGERILACAYGRPGRTGPRAAKFVARFEHQRHRAR